MLRIFTAYCIFTTNNELFFKLTGESIGCDQFTVEDQEETGNVA